MLRWYTACTLDLPALGSGSHLHLVNYISQRSLPKDEAQGKCWGAKKQYFSLAFSFSPLHFTDVYTRFGSLVHGARVAEPGFKL